MTQFEWINGFDSHNIIPPSFHLEDQTFLNEFSISL